MSWVKGEKITAICTSVQYNDLLQLTLPNTKSFFDLTVVVTDTKDDECAQICEREGVKCLRTDVFYKNQSVFNKAYAINLAMEKHPSQWYALIDADIYLRDGLDRSKLKKDCLHSMWRYDCYSRSQLLWSNLAGYNSLTYSDEQCKDRDGNSLMPGYLHIFYGHRFQAISRNAAEYDIRFNYLWPKEKRIWIGSCIHLCSKERQERFNLNWSGRTSLPFE